MAYSLNIQDMIDIGVSGYLEQARVGRIDDRSPLLADLYDPSVEETYGFSYDLQKAKDIMNEHAIQVDGVWYTKDTPTEWQDEYDDALPSTTGYNVKIGPYTIETPNGWSDFELHIETFQLQMEDLGIEINLETPEYSEFVGDSQSMNFELMLYGLGPGLLDSALTNFNYFYGPEGRGVNTTGWYNPDYVQLISQFETTVQGSEEEKNIAYQLQEEIAKGLPSIPLFGNGYWYSYNTEYWVGWPTEEANVMPPMAMWAFGTTGLMNQLLWSLEANTGQSPAQSNDANSIPAVVLMFSFVVMVTLKRKSRKHL
jgi:peptide/nickel transport system substrate-binding protein